MFRHMPDFNLGAVPAGNNHCPFGRTYLFTNENIPGYISNFDMRGKRVLSVAAGGDHAFECLLNGASYVDTFDINYAQKPIVELKSRMIRSLPYEDFMDFFFDKVHFFDRKIIEPIWNDFSQELRLYIDWYYCLGSVAPHHMFVYGRSNAPSYNIDNISYVADKSKYEFLAHRLPKKINFIHTDAYDIHTKIDKQYDFILMSNIFDYLEIPRFDAHSTLVHCYNKLLKPLSEHNLAEQNGYIMFDYIWSANKSGIYVGPEKWKFFMRKFNRQKKDMGQQMQRMDISSPFGPDYVDSVLYMTQNQKKR